MLYRFQIELSDIDRGVYESLDFRVAQHPSEAASYLLTRTLAFALSYQQGLEFSTGGLSDPDAPALLVKNDHGSTDLWIEIGNPSARKLHKASKAAKQVVVYTYKNPEALLEEIKSNNVHHAQDIKIYAFDSKFLQSLEACLEKNNRWSIMHQQGQLSVELGKELVASEVKFLSAT